jgi:hypothetical protein
VAGSCEHSNEIFSPVKGRSFRQTVPPLAYCFKVPSSIPPVASLKINT